MKTKKSSSVLIESLSAAEELPKGWKNISLEDYIFIAARIGWRGLKREEYTTDGPLFLAVKDIQEDGAIDFQNVTDHLSDYRYDESPEIQLKDQDIIITKDGTIGKIGFVEHLPGKVTVNSSLLIVRPSEEILPRFLFFYFRSPNFQSIVRDKITGSAVPHIFQKDIKRFQILVPPLAEQQQIVSRVEALLSNINTARNQLSRVPFIMKRFRQGVLAAACSGRLTEGWRDEHEITKSANQLFDRIQKERQILFNNEISLAQVQNRHPHYKKPEFLGEPDEEKLSQLYGLPEEWIYTKLGNLGEIVRGASPRPIGDPKFFGGDIPWITVGEVTKDENPYLTTVSKYLTKQGQEKSRTIPVDTLLLTNSGATLGVPKITRIEGCINDGSVAILKIPVTSKLYLYYFLKSQTQALREINQGMGQPNLNTDIVKEIVVPFPPLAEQHEIVRRVESLFERADAIEREVAAATKRTEALTQAVLGKAFRGELSQPGIVEVQI